MHVGCSVLHLKHGLPSDSRRVGTCSAPHCVHLLVGSSAPPAEYMYIYVPGSNAEMKRFKQVRLALKLLTQSLFSPVSLYDYLKPSLLVPHTQAVSQLTKLIHRSSLPSTRQSP